LKRHPVFGDIVQILAIVPFEIRRFHDHNVLQTSLFVNRITTQRKRFASQPSKDGKYGSCHSSL
jgi:hypothetical protein